MKQRSEIKQISTIMSASGETVKSIKDDKGTNAVAVTMKNITPNKGEEGKEKNK